MYGAVSREGITADLEAMKQVGLGGAYLMPIKDTEQGKEFNGTVRQLPHSGGKCCVSVCRKPIGRIKTRYAICDGFALAGGPWITPQESMQKVV